ncbi:uncharacterized protein Z520_07872 [Fonsecaea multimorphosa CBS 102226]|uniref:Uncharacterized protein n=1 Tax=Fonsecaea multimorphosa CBS 102226 TaxID=1442371 RepID=A0A0D2IHT8_9EURO|nr:uncharacterized protein Z520_07872 [Fonsecaea multimorphosa CBS 102226]KIX96606.1 hypothetical protein Z520_07872 [Fonsecaea multimorphosa CBS 102226]OAL22119.1 hypothetical protein AYO22_07479 [Fonsecaea multimorphosa]
MSRPASILTFSILICVSVLIVPPSAARPHSIWDISIDESPAPPPDQGPPLSAGALRDKSKLKYEIIGIVGAYLVWLIGTVVLLFLVGKKLRRRVQTSNRSLSMEIVKPAPLADQSKMAVEPPLKSPGKMASLRSWATGKSHSHKQSSISVSSTIDEKIIEADKARNKDEMARLYAAVMAHDEEKARSSGQTSPRTPTYPPQYNAPPTPRSPYHLPPTPRSPYYQPNLNLNGPASPRSPRYPPEFQHLRHPETEAQSQVVPPVGHALIHPLAPTPADDVSSMRTASQTSSRKKVSPLSFISGRSDSADQTRKRSTNISVRGQPISQPIGSATLTDASIYSEDALSSPRIYNPGPAPPTPGQKSAVTVVEEVEKKGPPAPLSLRSAAASNSSNSLPFRQFYNDALKSAPATKTTFVDRRESILGVHPKTGVPQTPYSPYMPYTPMTPVTPRTLMTRKEMKKNRKKEGLKVLTEDDMVLSDEDLWST